MAPATHRPEVDVHAEAARAVPGSCNPLRKTLEGTLAFHPAPGPNDAEVAAALATIRHRVQRLLVRHGLAPADDATGLADRLADEPPVLAGIVGASVQRRVALGPRAGARVRRLGGARDTAAVTSRGPRQAHLEGFDLHANVWVSVNDRAGLERLCRYVLRPPFAQARRRRRSDGRVALELKTAWPDGTRELLFEPLEFFERLAAMTARPETNLLICHGLLAPQPPRATREPARLSGILGRHRATVNRPTGPSTSRISDDEASRRRHEDAAPRPGADQGAGAPDSGGAGPELGPAGAGPTCARIFRKNGLRASSWAALMHRAFKFCGGCGAPLSAVPATPTAKFASPDTYTPKHLAAKILTSKAALEGERKQVMVLFADLKGSMDLRADRDPEEARKILDPVLELMMEAVHPYEGTVNQVMGDGIMALFGASLAPEDHAVRACYAALRMQDAIKRYADDVRHEKGVTVRIICGTCTQCGACSVSWAVGSRAPDRCTG